MFEFGVGDVPLWCYLTALAAVLAYWYGTSTHNTFKKMGIPYRKPLPFIGSIHTIINKAVADNDMNLVKTHGRISGTFQGRTPVVEIADAEFIKEVTIKEFSKFSNRRDVFASEDSKLIRHQLFSLEGDHWKHVRSMITPTFTSGKLKQMYPVISNCADKLVSHLKTAAAAPIVIKDYCAGYTMDVIASTAFGMDVDSQSSLDHPFIQHAGTFFGIPRKVTWASKIKQVISLIALFTMPPFVVRLMKRIGFSFLDEESLAYFEDIAEKVINSVSETPSERKNFISICTEKMIDLDTTDKQLIHTSTRGNIWSPKGLSRDEVAGNAISFFAAGYETTATALQFFFYSMVTFPDIQEKLYEAIMDVNENGEMSYEEIQKCEYLEYCLSECLRMYTPVMRFDRVAAEDVTIKGIHLPKGQIVNCMPYAVHHDPEYWDEPEEFRPERFSPENRTELQQYAYLPFGSGGRNCIAMRLALLEVKVAVVKLMTAFKFEKTAKTTSPGDLKFKKLTGFLQPESPIVLSAVPRQK